MTEQTTQPQATVTEKQTVLNPPQKDIPKLGVPQSQIVKSREIDSGNFGKVWAGTLKGQEIAIKELNIESPDTFQQFQKEISILR